MSNDELDPNGNLLWVLPQRVKVPGATREHLSHESTNSIELAMSPLVKWSMVVPLATVKKSIFFIAFFWSISIWEYVLKI